MSSGVVVDEEIVNAFQEFKIKKAHRFHTYVIKDTVIKIDKSGDRGSTYDDFVAVLGDNDPRYALIDLDFETKDGRPTSKLVFISWNPDSGSIRNKMLYSASKESIKTALNGVGIHINATDRSELDLEDSILPIVRKFA